MSAQGEPTRVETPSWRRNGAQVWHDGWRQVDRILRYAGECVGCGRRCYTFDGGENDPRGILGDHAGSNFEAQDYGMEGPEVVACFLCQNDEPNYRWALSRAKRRWTEPDDGNDPDDGGAFGGHEVTSDAEGGL